MSIWQTLRCALMGSREAKQSRRCPDHGLTCNRRIALEPLEDRRLLSVVAIFQDTFDSDPGWSCEGRWAFGAPTGGGGTAHDNPDPEGGCTGSNVYGVEINGDYWKQAGGPFYLTTGAIDTTGYENTQLGFYRWLNTADAEDVTATVDVSNDGSTWHNLYTNPTSAPVTDAAWQHEQYDISSYADDQSTVYVRWGYQKLYNNVPVYSGWNVDDVSVLGSEIDLTPPVALSIELAGANPTRAATVDWTVTFSETVSGVAAGDFELVTTGLTGAEITGVSGSDTTYTVTATTGEGMGTLGLNLVVGGSIVDEAGNPLATGFTGQVYDVDRMAAIRGVKWHDLDADGVRDAEEPGLAGVTVYVDLNGNGILDSGSEPETVTAADDLGTPEDEAGTYEFAGIAPGSYQVREVAPPDYVATYPLTPGPGTGELTFVESFYDDQGGVGGLDEAWAVAVAPDGNHVYVAGREDDALAVFSRDAATGAMTFVDVLRDSEVSWLRSPTGVVVSPDNQHVYVVAAESQAISVYDRDTTTGGLTRKQSLNSGTIGSYTLGSASSVTVSADGTGRVRDGHVRRRGDDFFA